MKSAKIGLGGGCHWCTEAVFQQIKGVNKVEQGYIASEGKAKEYSEGILVHYNPENVSLKELIEIHLHTHKSTSEHSFRTKYRSAVYYFNREEENSIKNILLELQSNFNTNIITQILPMLSFKLSRESIRDYYKKHPEAPFCKRYIEPKLNLLLTDFKEKVVAKNI
tara:strand:- start:86 stop:583 length:498 start_codon:yes stop_codon:yes gene_type:complete